MVEFPLYGGVNDVFPGGQGADVHYALDTDIKSGTAVAGVEGWLGWGG